MVKRNPWFSNVASDGRAPTHVMFPTFRGMHIDWHPFYSDEAGNAWWSTDEAQSDMIDWLQMAMEFDYDNDEEIIEAFELFNDGDPDNGGLFVEVIEAEDFVDHYSEYDFYWMLEDIGPIIAMYGTDPNAYPSWALKKLAEDDELYEMTSQWMSDDYGSKEGPEMVAFMDDLIDKVNNAVKKYWLRDNISVVKAGDSTKMGE